MAAVLIRDFLRAMGEKDHANGLPRHAVPGDLDGDELAWVEGWDAAEAAYATIASLPLEEAS